MHSTSALKNISIILVETKTPANIGAVARCMMNMGLDRLVLVQPPRDPQEEARKLAAGAHDILDAAAIHPSLREAVGDQKLVIGTSRHAGRMRKNIRTPRDMAVQMVPFLNRNPLSLVFGNEVNGLNKEDLALCHEFISIPSSEAFSSLNLSHAVMVVAYEFFVASLGPAVPVCLELADARDLKNFYQHLQATLEETGFLGHHPERMMFSLRQIFGRARLDPRDLSILRGIFRTMNRRHDNQE